MILKWIAILICLFLGYLCVKLLIKGNRDLSQTQGTPMDVVDDLERPRNQLLKSITQLRTENTNLKKRIEELENQQGSSHAE